MAFKGAGSSERRFISAEGQYTSVVCNCCRTDDGPNLPLLNHPKRKRQPSPFLKNDTTEENDNNIRSDLSIHSEDLRNTSKSRVRFTCKMAKLILNEINTQMEKN
mmetsp:Transcript_16909/g.24083  ORF Transcript_16909/g.24083 Transcript_16909/m.24083 type:complete len:105 (-) Transcript_16909:448-762(-)